MFMIHDTSFGHVSCLWSILQLRSVLVSVVSVLTEDHTNVHCLCCLLKPCWCPWTILLPRTLWGLWSMFGHGLCQSLCTILAPETMLKSVLILETMWVILIHAVTRNCVEIYDACHHWLSWVRNLFSGIMIMESNQHQNVTVNTLFFIHSTMLYSFLIFHNIY